MDRFKFRAWDKHNECWVKDLMMDDEGKFCEWLGSEGGYENENEFDLRVSYQFSDNYVIQQCTGLKDKNGELIFEGDIVGAPNYIKTETITIEIKWDEIIPCCCGGEGVGFDFELIYRQKDKWEIIGNIFENPELLEQVNE